MAQAQRHPASHPTNTQFGHAAPDSPNPLPQDTPESSLEMRTKPLHKER